MSPLYEKLPVEHLTPTRKAQLEYENYRIRMTEARIRKICRKGVPLARLTRYSLAMARLQLARSVRTIELEGLPFPQNYRPAPLVVWNVARRASKKADPK